MSATMSTVTGCLIHLPGSGQMQTAQPIAMRASARHCCSAVQPCLMRMAGLADAASYATCSASKVGRRQSSACCMLSSSGAAMVHSACCTCWTMLDFQPSFSNKLYSTLPQVSTWLRSWVAFAWWCRHVSSRMLRPPHSSGASGPPFHSCISASRTAVQVLEPSWVPFDRAAKYRLTARCEGSGPHMCQGRWAGARWSTGCGRSSPSRGSSGGRTP